MLVLKRVCPSTLSSIYAVLVFTCPIYYLRNPLNFYTSDIDLS